MSEFEEKYRALSDKEKFEEIKRISESYNINYQAVYTLIDLLTDDELKVKLLEESNVRRLFGRLITHSIKSDEKRMEVIGKFDDNAKQDILKMEESDDFKVAALRKYFTR